MSVVAKENDGFEKNTASQEVLQMPPFKAAVVWKNAIGFLVLHLLGLYGLYLGLFAAKPLTVIYAMIIGYLSSLGITVGNHRLFAHRSYKANAGLRLVLVFLQTVAGQNCAYIWARDHRQHHMYADTAADPHDSTRGFFFSHIGWLMVRKHPAVIAAGKNVNMSDLEADPIIMFQKKYYKRLYVLCSIILPCMAPCLLWDETVFNSFMVVFILRFVAVLNGTWCVNSAAHMFGTHPYDAKARASENAFVSLIAFGEGWHNYHHAFPYDYRASEFGMPLNTNATLIEFCAKMGWATDLRSVSKDGVMKKVMKAGDGTHHLWGNEVKDEAMKQGSNDVFLIRR